MQGTRSTSTEPREGAAVGVGGSGIGAATGATGVVPEGGDATGAGDGASPADPTEMTIWSTYTIWQYERGDIGGVVVAFEMVLSYR